MDVKVENLQTSKFCVLVSSFLYTHICSGIYITITRILKSLAKQQEAYLLHQACGRGKETNLASSVEHFPKWYLYGSLKMATLQRWTRGLNKSASAGPAAS